MLGKTRQAYFKFDENSKYERALINSIALNYAMSVRAKDQGIGVVKIWEMYARNFVGNTYDMLGRDSFIDLMRNHNLMIRIRRAKQAKTTDSTHGLPVYPNLIYDLIPTRPNQIWVSDITYIEVKPQNGDSYFAYLTLIMDSYTKEVVGWSVGETLEKEHAIRALEIALSSREIGDYTLTHHSDRGTQYASKAYTNILKENKIHISMTENGDPKQNAEAERLNNTFKNEFFKGTTFTSTKEVEDEVRRAIDFYNNERPHMSLDYLTPAEAFNLTGEIKKRWHSYREDAIRNQNRQVEAANAI